MRFCVLFFIFASTLMARGVNALKNEWIIDRGVERGAKPWQQLRSELRSQFSFVRSFGPGKRFGLFRSPEKVGKGKPFRLPKNIKLYPNLVYDAFDHLDPDFEKNWGLQNTGQSAGSLEGGTIGTDTAVVPAWELFKGSKDTIIAILDTGVDLKHEDLLGNHWRNSKEIVGNGKDDDGNGYVDDVDGWNFVSQTNNIQDDNQHGTFIAGVIGSTPGNKKGSRGVLWNGAVMSIKILDVDGHGTTERAVSGIEYAVRNGARIINASWGGAGFDQVLWDAIKWASEEGVLFIAASGNSAQNNDFDANPIYPAAFKLPNVLTVAAYDNRDKISTFSNFGKETTHIGAPGVQIYSTTLGGYRYADGTSYAAPFVSGVAALVWGHQPQLSFLELKDRLLWTSVPIHYYEREKTLTGGRVSAFNALKNIRPNRPMTPTVWKKFSYTAQTAHPYLNYEKLNFTISHPGAKHIRIHFSRFETESGYDQVILKDSAGLTVNSYSGEIGDFKTSDALGDTIHFDFVADYAKTKYGVDIDYYEVSFED